MLRIPTRSRAGFVGFSPDGGLLAVAGPYESGVRLYDSFTGMLVRPLRPAGAGGPGWDAVFSPDGRHLAARQASGRANEVAVWEVASGTPRAVLPGSAAPPAFDPHRPAVAVVCSRPDPDADPAPTNPPARVWFFDPVTGDPLAARLRPTDPLGWSVLALAFDPAGGRLTVADAARVRRFERTPGGDGAARRWGATPPRWAERPGTPADGTWGWASVAADGTVWAVRSHPAGRRTPATHDLVAVTADGGRVAVQVADTPGLPTRTIGVDGRLLGPVWAVSPDGRLAARADGPAVEVWEPAGGTRVGRLDPGLGPVGCLALAPDGLRAAAGGKPGVAVWDVGG